MLLEVVKKIGTSLYEIEKNDLILCFSFLFLHYFYLLRKFFFFLTVSLLKKMGKKLATFCMLLGHQRYLDILGYLNTLSLRKLSNAVIFIARTFCREVLLFLI